MRHHVAILQARPLKLILAGHKTIESRITRGRLAPWNCIAPGDVIHLKKSSGPFVAKAIAGKIHPYDKLTPARIAQLKKQFNDRILGPDEYWQQKQHCRYATFITLTHVTPAHTGPAFPKSYGLAWFVLNDPASHPSPANTRACHTAQIILTAGALKNRYLLAPKIMALGPVTLLLSADRVLQTHVTPKGRIASRRWAGDFKQLVPGDIALFVPQGHRRYRVSFKTSTNQTTQEF